MTTSPSSSMMALGMSKVTADTSAMKHVPERGVLHTTAATTRTTFSLWHSLRVPENAKEHFASVSEAECLIFNLIVLKFSYLTSKKEKNEE